MRRSRWNKSGNKPDLRETAILLGIENAKADLRQSGGAYDMERVCALLGGVSPQDVLTRIQKRSLFTVPNANGQQVFPAVQFADDGQPVADLKAALEAFPSKNGCAFLNFLVNPHNDLDGARPIDKLLAGQVDIVVIAARRSGVQGG